MKKCLTTLAVAAPGGGGETIHTLTIFTSVEDRMLVIGYSCSLTRDSGCGALGMRIVESIRITPVAK